MRRRDCPAPALTRVFSRLKPAGMSRWRGLSQPRPRERLDCAGERTTIRHRDSPRPGQTCQTDCNCLKAKCQRFPRASPAETPMVIGGRAQARPSTQRELGVTPTTLERRYYRQVGPRDRRRKPTGRIRRRPRDPHSLGTPGLYETSQRHWKCQTPRRSRTVAIPVAPRWQQGVPSAHAHRLDTVVASADSQRYERSVCPSLSATFVLYIPARSAGAVIPGPMRPGD
jgi:hypothetical protein